MCAILSKCMIQCGLSKDLDGWWRLDQLSTKLKENFQTDPENSNGVVPVNNQGIVLYGY